MASRSSISTVHRLASIAYAVITIAPAALLVVFLVASLLLSGGQVSPTMDVKWNAVVPYPIFPVPTTILVGAAIVSVVLAVVVVASARADDVVGMRGLIGPTVAAIISAVIFAGIVPDGGTRMGDAVWGAQVAAAAISAVALAVLLVGTAVVRSRGKSEAGRPA